MSFTVHDLNEMLGKTIEGPVEVDLTDANIDVPFGDLGYDSLTLLALVSTVERTCATRLPDTALEHMGTPREAVDYISAVLDGSRAVGAE